MFLSSKVQTDALTQPRNVHDMIRHASFGKDARRYTVAISERTSGDDGPGRPLVEPSWFEISVSVLEGWHTLHPVGEMDLSSRTVLNDVLGGIFTGDPQGIALDLSRVSFIDSCGVQAVVALDSRCRERGIELRIVSGPRAVQRVFELCGLLTSLPFVDV